MFDFDPVIIVFACSWCPYINADNAGARKREYPAQIRLIRTQCTGRLTPAIILKSFQCGADGVLVTGCHIGECHFISGNERCEEVIKETRKLMGLLGIEPERLGSEWFTPTEDARFTMVMADFAKKIRSIGLLAREPA